MCFALFVASMFAFFDILICQVVLKSFDRSNFQYCLSTSETGESHRRGFEAMPSSKRTDSPAPKVAPSSKGPEKANGVIERKQTRPIGEFYGNIGTGFWTFFIPVAIYYFYGIMVMHHGRLVIPGPSFWKDLIWTLPDGISIRPCWGPTLVSLTWVCCQALGEMILPGQMKEGVMLKSGRKLIYPMNGLLCFFLSNIGLYLLCKYEVFSFLTPYYVFENMGALLTEAVITSYVMALWLYVDFGIFWKRHVNDPAAQLQNHQDRNCETNVFFFFMIFRHF